MRTLLLTLQAPAGFDFPLVTALTFFIAMPVKILVDVIKGAMPKLPPTLLPVIGLVIGFLFSLLVLIAAETAFKSAVYAQCFIAAVGAQAGAMAASGLQNRVNKVEERVQTALDSPAGTTKEQLDKIVERQN